MTIPTSQINTIGIIVAIGAAIVGPIVVQSSNNTKFEILTSQLVEGQKRQDERNIALDADRKAGQASYQAQSRDFLGVITELGSANKSIGADVARLQEVDKTLNARQDRMGDVYNDRFDEIRAGMSALSTAQALTNQRQDEIKALLERLLPAMGKRGAEPSNLSAEKFEPFKIGKQ